jgi:hypothetical protein
MMTPQTEYIPPIGQTAWGAAGGRGVVIEVIKADAFYVQWRSLDLQWAGSMPTGQWNEMRAAQQAALKEEQSNA